MKKFLAILLLLAIAVSCFACSKEAENPTESTSDNASLNAEATPNTDPTANPSGETQPPQGDPTETTEPTEPPVLPEMEILGTPGYGMNDSMACNHYTVTEATPTDENMTTPLAVFGPNQEVVFENRHLQIAYWMEYLNFMGTYGSYASMVGMDTTLPLWAQEIDPGKTWEQYFLDFAVKGLERNYALARYAAENGIELTPEQQSAIDDILSPDGDFATEYTEQGYADGDSYISYYFGAGANVQAYYEYYAMYSAAANCYQVKQKELAAALTEADILAYYAENKEKFETQGKLQVNNINVRHILLQPEGEESTWTEETWAAAEAAAQAIYDEWLKNPTEENFAALATEHTTDPGSKDTGGLYEEVSPGQMVAEFNDWCFDPARQVGDHGIVKTSYGFHIMYFSGQTETRAWYDTAAEELSYEQLQAFMDSCMEEYPLSVDYTKARIFDVLTANTAAPVG